MANLTPEQQQRLDDFTTELSDLSDITFNRDDSDTQKMVYLLHEVAKQLIYLNNKVESIEERLTEISYKD